jgi:predicted ATPase
MQRYILTGAPGAGKTVILRALQQAGHAVVEEAATDVCARQLALGHAEPWTRPRFIEDIVRLQRRRQALAATFSDSIQVFDRSPVCTLALARHLGLAVPEVLTRELERIRREQVYRRQVFFIESLGFMTNTEVRRIGLEEAGRFGELHEGAYRELGYELFRIAPGTPEGRALAVWRAIEAAGV